MKSIHDIDLSPKPGKKYWKSCHREWREEFIMDILLNNWKMCEIYKTLFKLCNG